MSELIDDDVAAVADKILHEHEEHELDVSADSPALSLFAKIHPVAYVATGALIAAAIGHVAFDTDRLIGNMDWWHWLLLAAIAGLGFVPEVLNKVRVAIELIGAGALRITWVCGWLVFIVQFINVLTRYLNPRFEQDILLGELTSAAWQLFALIALIGLPYGVMAAVNPRIDFWWADWQDRTKAWLDFIMHTFFFLPFLFTMTVILQGYAATALGKKRGDGSWPDGWKVWNSWEGSPDADQLPLGPIKAMVFVGFVFFSLQIFAEIIKTGFVLMGNRKYGKIAAGDEFQRIE